MQIKHSPLNTGFGRPVAPPRPLVAVPLPRPLVAVTFAAAAP